MLKERRIRCVKLLTNGSLMTSEKAIDVINAGVDIVEFAVETTDKALYESIRVGLTLETVIENIKHFLTLRRAYDARTVVDLTTVVHSDTFGQVQGDVKFWSKLLREDDLIRLVPRHNFAREEFAGGISEVLGSNDPCTIFNTTLDICADGIVRMCCADAEVQYEMGDANTESLLDIFNNGNFRRVRDMHNSGRRKDIDLCSVCNQPEACKSFIFHPRKDTRAENLEALFGG